ncbi:MAG: LamG-like jellyroll fold domain-containing protein [Saprospiraceae bacterium]
MQTSRRLLTLFLLLFTFCSATTYAQTSCATDRIHEQMKEIDPTYELRLAESKEQLKQYISNKNKNGEAALKSGGTYTIPVVFHVIYTSESAANNISDAQLESAVQRLNDIFSNAVGTSVNTGIQFQLATMDEDCQPTTGINRVSGASVTNYTSHGIDGEVFDTDGIGASMSGIFSLSRWNPDIYMNVYVVSEIENNNAGYGTQGYAFYPTTSNTYHGIVMMYNTLGYDYDNCNCYELKSYTDENEAFAHEVGHYLNLKHTFEGGSSSTCPSTADEDGDEVADTPAHKYQTSCSYSGGNTCYASTHEFYDWEKIIHNYMGYAGESCYSEFSDGQAERMIAALETIRPSLLYSPGIQTSNVTLTSADCTPQTSVGLGANYGVGPTLVVINDLEASSGSAYSDGGYLERPCFSTSLDVDQTYNIEITTYGYYNEDVRVYIDYDNDGSMSESELVFSGDNGTYFSGSFTVPNSAAQGEWVRARVITDHKQYTISSSCYAPTYGQVEDYPVYINALNATLSTSKTSLSGFQALTTDASSSQTFTVSGSSISGNVTVSTSSNDFEISSNGTSFSSSITFTPVNLTLSVSTVYVRLKAGLTEGSKSGSVSIAASGASTLSVSLSGYVIEFNPTIEVSTAELADFQTLSTKASAAQSFTLSGNDLVSEVSIGLDNTDFEMSSNGVDYESSLTFSPSNLTLSEKTVYVRLKSDLLVGTYSATITISSSGVSDQTVSLTGEVGEISITRGNAMFFDGNGDGVSTNFNAISGGQSRTFEAWVKPDDEGPIFGYGVNSTNKKWIIRTDGNGRLRTEINGASIVGETVITDGQWHHIAVVLDNTNGSNLNNTTLYVDGKAEAISSSSNLTNTINTDASGTLTIGRDMQGRYFQGEIDEARVWENARTDQEIRENMHLTLTGSETGLVAYYQFDDDNSSAIDWVGGYTGSLEGDAYFAASTINCGREGTSQTVTGISSAGAQTFSEANFAITFLEKTGTEDFTATYQEFTPNTSNGTEDFSPFNNPVWTLNQSSNNGTFLGNLSFTFPDNTLTETELDFYSLYYRTMGSDGEWIELKGWASSIVGQTIIFDSISTTGQFMVVQTQQSTERGYTLTLSGTGDYLEVPHSFNPANDELTLECWVKLDSEYNDCQAIFHSSNGAGSPFFFAVWNGCPHVRFAWQWLPIQEGVTFPYGVWQHVAFTWDGTNAIVFLNGIEVGGGEMKTHNFDLSTLDFGAYANSFLYMNGQLEELRIWPEARTQLEILDNMHLTATSKTLSAATYFSLIQGAIIRWKC